MTAPPSMLTPRLELIPATAKAVRAAAEGDYARVGELLGAEIAADWPPELLSDALAPLADRLEKQEPTHCYCTYFVVHRQPRVLIGTVGYVGPPQDGRVEIGYGIVASYQRRGLASEATRRLVERAMEDPGVSRVVAQTYPDLVASIRVLEKCGFRLCATGITGFTGEENVSQYELTREAWRAIPV